MGQRAGRDQGRLAHAVPQTVQGRGEAVLAAVRGEQLGLWSRRPPLERRDAQAQEPQGPTAPVRPPQAPRRLVLEHGDRLLRDVLAEALESVEPADGIHRTADLLRALEPARSGTLFNYVWNKWYRASAIQKHRIRYEHDVWLGEDFLFNCAYLRTCDSVAVTTQPLYRYYKRAGDSLTSRFRADEMARRRRLDGALAELFGRFALVTECKAVVDLIVGAAALDSVSSVGLRDCRLSHAGKVRFVGEFLDSEYRELIGLYRHAPGVSMVRRLECALAERHATWSLTSLLVLVARAKRAMGR